MQILKSLKDLPMNMHGDLQKNEISFFERSQNRFGYWAGHHYPFFSFLLSKRRRKR
jgi:hypothetical protein